MKNNTARLWIYNQSQNIIKQSMYYIKIDNKISNDIKQLTENLTCLNFADTIDLLKDK